MRGWILDEELGKVGSECRRPRPEFFLIWRGNRASGQIASRTAQFKVLQHHTGTVSLRPKHLDKGVRCGHFDGCHLACRQSQTVPVAYRQGNQEWRKCDGIYDRQDSAYLVYSYRPCRVCDQNSAEEHSQLRKVHQPQRPAGNDAEPGHHSDCKERVVAELAWRVRSQIWRRQLHLIGKEDRRSE